MVYQSQFWLIVPYFLIFWKEQYSGEHVFFHRFVPVFGTVGPSFSCEIRVACRISGASSEIESCSLYAFSLAKTWPGKWYGKKQSMEIAEKDEGENEKKSGKEKRDRSTSSYTVQPLRSMNQHGRMSHKIKNEIKGNSSARCVWKFLLLCCFVKISFLLIVCRFSFLFYYNFKNP